MPRLRIQAVMVQLVAFSDDGENLDPLKVQPLAIPYAQWQAFIDGGFKEAVDGLRAQVEGEPEREKDSDVEDGT